MKTFQFILLFTVVVLCSLTTTATAYKFSSKHEHNHMDPSLTPDDHLKNNNINTYKKYKDAPVKIGSFKHNNNSNNMGAKSSNIKANFGKRNYYDEEEDCDNVVYIIDSYVNDSFFNTNKICNSDLKVYMKNIKKYQECFPEDLLGFRMEAQVYSFCMVDSKGNLCPLSRRINKDKKFKLSPTIENYKLNCVSEKCRQESILLNRSHQESFGEEVTYKDIESFEEIEEYLNSKDCLSMTME